MIRKSISLKLIDNLININLLIILATGIGTAYSILNTSNTLSTEPALTQLHVLGISNTSNCIDSDSLSRYKSIYIPGEVTYTQPDGNISIFQDHCIEDNKKLVEESCEYDSKDAQMKIKNLVYTCEKSCNNGACSL